MFSLNQRIDNAEIDSLLKQGWKIVDFSCGVEKDMWNRLLSAYEKLGKDSFKVISFEGIEGAPKLVSGVIIIESGEKKEKQV